MSFSDEELAEFKAEATELLDSAEKSLLALDAGAELACEFDAIFRGFHNLKGAAGMMELHDLQAHTHELENILMELKGSPCMSKEHIGFFLRGVDAAKQILEGQKVSFSYQVASSQAPVVVQQNETAPVPPSAEPHLPELDSTTLEFTAECDEIVERVAKCLERLEREHAMDCLDALYRDVHSLKGSAYLFSFTSLGDLSHAMESSLEGVRNGTHEPSKTLINEVFQSLKLIDQLVNRIKHRQSDQDLVADVRTQAEKLLAAARQLEVFNKDNEVVPLAKPTQETPQVIVEKQEALNKEKESDSNSSIRVPVALLDNLMTLMGEMVLVRNQVIQYSNRSDDREFLSMSKRLNVVTSEIQVEMMKTRMQPIGTVLGKFNRVVRDLSQELGKKIQLQLFGIETELDKSLLEAIKDPLTHIVRNSCDHGIELPQVRRDSGKPDQGTISIRSYHEGGQVIVEIQDDGKGLNPETLKAKAIEKGLISAGDAAKLSDKQAYNLIFEPGFSTAAKVTNVSGRGVGMDVVRTNIEKIGGTVELMSQAGRGTNTKLKIPLTLAIVPALIVKCAEQTFAIPQVKLEELVRVDQTAGDSKVENLHGAPVLRLRGNILPLVDLHKVLNTGRQTNYQTGILNIAVLNADNTSFGLIIDEVQDTADIVVKPLSRLLKDLLVYSGATILGNGSVALILDVLGIAKVAQIGIEKGEGQEIVETTKESSAEFQDYLLVRVNSQTKHAIVLGYVHRLEEFDSKKVEHSGNFRVVRYGNTILPLISINKVLRYPMVSAEVPSQEKISVVVVKRAGQLYGIEVDSILDTLRTNCPLELNPMKQTGIFGNLNTSQELIVVVDPFELILSEFPELSDQRPIHLKNDFESPQGQNSNGQTVTLGKKRILLAEDTVFFRRAIRNVIEKVGYEVVTVNDGQEAIDLINQDAKGFDLIISDIEMPRINGFQLAEAVRRHPKFSSIPLMAVSSRADVTFIEEGKKAGFDVYLEKLKPDTLINEISKLVQKEKRVA